MSARTRSNSPNSRNSDDDDHDGNKPANATPAAKTKVRGHDLLAYGQRQIDRVVSPATRQRAIDSATAFASRRPLLSLFLTAHVLLSLLPLLLFATFVFSTTVFAVLFALAFVLFWTGLALLVLVPTLFFTGGLAILLWLWAMGTFITLRVLYNRLPASLRSNTDKHVISHKGESPAQSSSERGPAHDFHSDEATDVEAAETKNTLLANTTTDVEAAETENALPANTTTA
ncbi:hypothetical protein F5Y14DRAFT_358781 [Nemania sp. NC0429]|nr:hypothetical protein F5Y14DRAFT_358781 [Nemania sp. NC0429]